MTIAYLNSEYPSLSHTFIEREVRFLRRRGESIRTFSVRGANRLGQLGAMHESAAGETNVIRASHAVVLRDFLIGAVRNPAGLCRALVASQRLSPPGIRSRLRHAAYVVQGVRLSRQLAEEGIRHVHVHMANNSAAIAMMACEYDGRLSYSLSIHGSAEFFHVDSWTLRQKAESAEFVRCISEFCRAQVMAWTDPGVWDRFHVVHCGIDPAAYPPRPINRTGPLRLLTVGRLHPIKGYDVLLDACGRLKRDGVAFELEMVGEGPMRARLEARIANLHLGDRVHLAGAVDQDRIGAYYDRADVMVISSFMEGVPVVLMEAMAKELGVVATRVGGVPELVEEGISGFLVDAGSGSSLATAIRTYADDVRLCRTHGANGRRRVLGDYHIEQTAEGMESLFARYLKRGARQDHSIQDRAVINSKRTEKHEGADTRA